MKKLLLTLCASFCLASAALAQSAAQKVAGTYTGTVYVSLSGPVDVDNPGDALTFTDQKVDIVATDTVSNTIDFTLYDFRFTEALQLGNVNLQNVGVKDSIAGITVFRPMEPAELTFLRDTPMQIDAAVSIDNTQSTITDSEASIMLNVMWHMPNDDAPISVAFVGKKAVDAGISSVTTTGAQAKGIYTLTGVRMPNTDATNLPKGIYIINGKKTIIK
mgnify:CR=1 FL=1